MADIDIYFGLNGANPSAGYNVYYRPRGTVTYVLYPQIFYSSPATLVGLTSLAQGYEGYIEAYCGFQDFWATDNPEPPETTTTSTSTTSTTSTTTACIQATVISSTYEDNTTSTTTTTTFIQEEVFIDICVTQINSTLASGTIFLSDIISETTTFSIAVIDTGGNIHYAITTVFLGLDSGNFSCNITSGEIPSDAYLDPSPASNTLQTYIMRNFLGDC